MDHLICIPIACGFCVPGFTPVLLPVLPAWALVFVVWTAFLRSRDPAGPFGSGLKWFMYGLFIFFLGPIMMLAFWGLFVVVWIAGLLYCAVQASRQARSLRYAASTAPDMDVMWGTCTAARFHTLTLLALGVTACISVVIHAAGLTPSLSWR